MRLTSINKISNFRSLASVGPIELGDVTVLVGPNNAGKSSVLHAVLLLQQNLGVGGRHVRLRETQAEITFTARDLDRFGRWAAHAEKAVIGIGLDTAGNLRIELKTALGTEEIDQLPGREPDHLIVPFLSRRRPETFNQDVREEYATGVYPDMRYLAAKLSRVAQPAHPSHAAYAEACERILGVLVTAVPAPHGQMPGVFVGRSEAIPLEDMGAGVAQVVALLADLALAEDKIFVVEEPENDLHPAALRALLDLMVEAADRNQFLVSTHSNLVLRHLGSRPSSRIHHVKSDGTGAWPPVTTVEEVPPEPAARSQILIDLGYELRDFEFFDGWLFLEESSAESIIRDHLIPWFAPGLGGRLRVVSARGASRVKPVFDDFNRLVLFTHLEQRYRNRAWVVVDGDQAGTEIVEKLRAAYADAWDAERFVALGQGDFERYYPPRFEAAVEAALAQSDRGRRRESKRHLLREVLAWIEVSPDLARAEFESSAAEIVSLLRDIEASLGGVRAESVSV